MSFGKSPRSSTAVLSKQSGLSLLWNLFMVFSDGHSCVDYHNHIQEPLLSILCQRCYSFDFLIMDSLIGRLEFHCDFDLHFLQLVMLRILFKNLKILFHLLYSVSDACVCSSCTLYTSSFPEFPQFAFSFIASISVSSLEQFFQCPSTVYLFS